MKKALMRMENVLLKLIPDYFRPAEVESLLGDATKAKDNLGWEPKTGLDEMIQEMMQHDMKLADNELLINNKN